jgi:hypothetical protein
MERLKIRQSGKFQSIVKEIQNDFIQQGWLTTSEFYNVGNDVPQSLFLPLTL